MRFSSQSQTKTTTRITRKFYKRVRGGIPKKFKFFMHKTLIRKNCFIKKVVNFQNEKEDINKFYCDLLAWGIFGLEKEIEWIFREFWYQASAPYGPRSNISRPSFWSPETSPWLLFGLDSYFPGPRNVL